ncbi:hypothetical protein F5B22DRAFT_411586 [Xylaria bambusicola]|uniref:uncharacterized protein n=1 Tax=Xylaria bambusicola TaxID=326684 RepID=UPI002007CBB5|nr:uncharacterized protein F5B22DRAFT_411586 [Xylaria bambusicola]KAI0523731.1 hypothetical protein F5B22DRAFT_411586 [Xylaria bambusicola]
MTMLHQMLPGLLGAAWCCLVLLGAAWCCLVLLGAAWCCLVLLGAAWLLACRRLVHQDEKAGCKSRLGIACTFPPPPTSPFFTQSADLPPTAVASLSIIHSFFFTRLKLGQVAPVIYSAPVHHLVLVHVSFLPPSD